jgi:uncharacterized protein
VVSRKSALILLVLFLLHAPGCQPRKQATRSSEALPVKPVLKPLPANASSELKLLIDGAVAQAGVTTGYDPAYVKLDYPGGDVAIETGVCSDVVVRAFRKATIDLQKEVHEDMQAARAAYPTKWNSAAIDSNIDHRRVLNLTTLFERKGKAVPITANKDDYLPGDIVAWDLGNDVDHIGIVTNHWAEPEKRFLIVHNIGAGARVEDVLFNWKITGHYRYFN